MTPLALARSVVKDGRVSDVDLLSTPFVPALAAQLLAQLLRRLKQWENLESKEDLL